VEVTNGRSGKNAGRDSGDTEGRQIPLIQTTAPEQATTAEIPADLDPFRSANTSVRPEQEFFIPVHGQVRLTRSEVQVVNHPAFQRLGYVYQLGQTHLVFRGATHRRIEHALGTLHVAQMMIDQINENSRHLKCPADATWQYDRELTAFEISMIRLAALLHDIGHLPAGHTLEDELGLLPGHDEMQRISLILDRPRWHARPCQTLRHLIDAEYDADVKAAGCTVSASTIVTAIVAKDPPPIQSGIPLRIGVCRDLVGNTICADLIDYLHRDWHHLGKPRFFDRRLIEYMELRKRPSDGAGEGESQIVVNLRSSEQVRTDAVTAILDLLESRYQLGEVALYHRTKLCAAAMLERAVAELADSQGAKRQTWLEDLVDDLLEFSDEQMLEHLEAVAQAAMKGSKGRERSYLEAAIEITRSLRMRTLYKQIYVAPAYHLANRAGAVQRLYSGAGIQNRLRALRSLEEDFELSPCSLAMYCPPSAMNAKIAAVKVLVDDSVVSLDEHEQSEQDAGLTGGHLAAQKKRFGRLWRFLIAISPEALEQVQRKRTYPVLIRAIESLVIGRAPTGVTLDEQAESIAHELGALLGRSTVATGVAARGADFVEPYPTGAPALRNFFGKSIEQG
jgi:HD superfamily phosphohydrolase